jgi:hypothetical protein
MDFFIETDSQFVFSFDKMSDLPSMNASTKGRESRLPPVRGGEIRTNRTSTSEGRGPPPAQIPNCGFYGFYRKPGSLRIYSLPVLLEWF